jgi:L-ectoine synthase
MIVRRIEDVENTEFEVGTDEWTSKRLLVQKDGMGFSFHETIIKAGAELHLHYKHHLEAVYCLEGEGEITDLATGTTYKIEKGVIYALDQHDKHILKAHSQLRFACVFNPPVTGQEVHDKDGAYALATS